MYSFWLLIRQDQSTGYAATYLPDTPEMIIPPLYYAIVDSMFWLYFLHMSSQNALSDVSLIMSGEDKANLVISIIEVITSLFLVLKSKTISKFILKISK